MAIEPTLHDFSLPTIPYPNVYEVPKAANENGRTWPLIPFSRRRVRRLLTESLESYCQSASKNCTRNIACALKPRCSPNTPMSRVPRSIHESARDIARNIAKTAAYLSSRQQRKKVEMLRSPQTHPQARSIAAPRSLGRTRRVLACCHRSEPAEPG